MRIPLKMRSNQIIKLQSSRIALKTQNCFDLTWNVCCNKQLQFGQLSRSIQMPFRISQITVRHGTILNIYIQMQELSMELPLALLLNLEQKYWHHNNRISTAFNFVICKKLMVDAKFEFKRYQRYVDCIDQFMAAMIPMKQYQVLAGLWLNTLIFNVAALNDDYKEQLSHSLSVSSHDSHDLSIQILNNLQTLQKTSLSYLLNMPCLHHLLTSPKLPQPQPTDTTSHRTQHEMLYALFSTINYLHEKMGIEIGYQEKLGLFLGTLSQSLGEGYQRGIQEEVRGTVNGVVFGTTNDKGYDVKRLQTSLNNNYNANLMSIASLIDANYHKDHNSRPIFSDCLLSGAQVTQHLISLVITTSNKNHLFSQQMQQSSPPFQLFLSIVQHRHLNLYALWLQLLNTHFQSPQSPESPQITKKISNFLYQILTEHEQFVQLLKFMAELLGKKMAYTDGVVMDLMKKFLLNRFLLDPAIYYSYTWVDIGEEEFGKEVNLIRLMFYPKKTQSKGSQEIQAIFARLIFGTGNSTPKQARKNLVYHLDQSLKKDYETIFCDLFEPYSEPQPKHNKSDSSQVSFSFLKNTPRQDHSTVRNPQSNHTIKTPIPQQNFTPNLILPNPNPNPNPTQIPNLTSPKSQKSTKTTHTHHTQTPDVPTIDPELSILEQLVNRRRMLGIARRAIDARRSKRAEIREKMSRYYQQVHSRFEDFRRDIERHANLVRLEIQML